MDPDRRSKPAIADPSGRSAPDDTGPCTHRAPITSLIVGPSIPSDLRSAISDRPITETSEIRCRTRALPPILCPAAASAPAAATAPSRPLCDTASRSSATSSWRRSTTSITNSCSSSENGAVDWRKPPTDATSCGRSCHGRRAGGRQPMTSRPSLRSPQTPTCSGAGGCAPRPWESSPAMATRACATSTPCSTTTATASPAAAPSKPLPTPWPTRSNKVGRCACGAPSTGSMSDSGQGMAATAGTCRSSTLR